MKIVTQIDLPLLKKDLQTILAVDPTIVRKEYEKILRVDSRLVIEKPRNNAAIWPIPCEKSLIIITLVNLSLVSETR